MTFLEIVKEVARLSGTVDPRSIETLEGAEGRIALLANVVEAAWTEIQNTYHAWRFLTKELPTNTTLDDGIAAYTAANLGLSDWSEWIPGTAPGTIPLTLWKPTEAGSTYRADEQALAFAASYPEFRSSYQTGTNASTTGRPQSFSIDVQDRLVFWPTPDDDYHLAGTYRRSAQVLSADSDKPIIADQYHRTLVHAAKLLLDHSDEADGNVLLADIELPLTFQHSLASLRRRYLSGGISLSRGRPVGGGGFRPVAPVSVVVSG